jgi:hypothetical protein
MDIKKAAQEKVVSLIQKQLDEAHAGIRANKRSINALAVEQAKLKKVRYYLTSILRDINPYMGKK